MERYPSYKDSGVEWIGEIPGHWRISKFKYDTSTPVQYGLNISGDKYVEDGIRFIRITDIAENGELNPTDGKYLNQFDVPKEFLLKKFDVLFCRSGHTVGKTYLHLSDGYYTSGGYLVKFNFRNYFESKFIFYVSKTDFYWDWIVFATIVSTIENVNGEKYRNFIYPKPPLPEQQQIVSFLDNKTALIDKLIETKKRKIELLKEYRTSLINQVVTKGLNPNVEMKDSGVEWIGEIPSHWDIRRLKHFCTMLTEKGQPNNGDIKISPENVESDSGYCFNLYSDYSGEGVKFKIGDILLNKLRLYLKKVLFAGYEGYSMGEMIVLRVFNGFNKFFYLTLFHQSLIDELDNQSTGVKLPRVSPEIILNTKFPFPPLSEQHQIVSYLDEKTSNIDKETAVEERKIELLKEYRQSLISEVVTGKIKVTCDE